MRVTSGAEWSCKGCTNLKGDSITSHKVDAASVRCQSLLTGELKNRIGDEFDHEARKVGHGRLTSTLQQR